MQPKRRGPVPRPPLERFLAHLECGGTHGCWLWTGALLKRNGYGVFNRGRNVAHYAHRLAYEYFIGPIPAGRQVQHRCSGLYARGDITYRRCCNPEHLKLGSARDNLEQAVAEGRFTMPPVRRGEASNTAVLSNERVRAIRLAAASGATYAELGRLYGVRADTIRAVVRRQTWGHVP